MNPATDPTVSPTGAHSAAALQKRCLLLLCAGRGIALIGVLMSIFGVVSYTAIPQTSLAAVVVCFLISLTLVQSVAIWRSINLHVLGFFQLMLDVILLTLVLQLEKSSSAFGVYLLLIACASLVLRPNFVILIASTAGISYGMLSSGLLGAGAGSFRFTSSIDILIAYASLIVTAFIATNYSRYLRQLTRSVNTKDEEIARINKQQLELMNSLSEGVIMLNLDSAITGINHAAKAILGLKGVYDGNLVGKKLDDAIPGLSSSFDEKGCETGTLETEFVIQRPEGETTLRCSMQELHSQEMDIEATKIIFMSDIGELRSIEGRLDFYERMQRIVSDIEQGERHSGSIPSLIGSSEAILTLSEMILKVAPSDVPILIQGESGTGKELVAKAIHENSNRKEGSFIAINCGAMPENLIESELFGYKRGSFTGADRDTLGLFREANGGTLLLDEVGELPLHLQAKLLRVLQEKVVRPVGSTKEIPIDVRIIAATHRNLREESQIGTFREDLFYRLRVIELGIPALRERTEDIPVLISYFLEREGVSREDVRITSEVMSCLLQYDYPGNVRELENILARAHVLGGDEISIEHLPEEVRTYRPREGIPSIQSSLPVDIDKLLADIEREYLIRALAEANGVKKKAASLLGLNFRSIRYRLKKYNLDDVDDLESSSQHRSKDEAKVASP